MGPKIVNKIHTSTQFFVRKITRKNKYPEIAVGSKYTPYSARTVLFYPDLATCIICHGKA